MLRIGPSTVVTDRCESSTQSSPLGVVSSTIDEYSNPVRGLRGPQCAWWVDNTTVIA